MSNHFEIECVDEVAKREEGILQRPHGNRKAGRAGPNVDIEIQTLVSSIPSAMIVSLSHSVLARLAWVNSTGRLL